MKRSMLMLAVLFSSGAFNPQMYAQINHKPVYRFRVPPIVLYFPTSPLRFAVSASDPDGDTLTFTWKINAGIVKSGPDSSFIFNPSDLRYPYTIVMCVFSDPGGLSDSTMWRIGPDLYVGEPSVPREFKLGQNYPNPFNPGTTIQYELPEAGSVTLKIYDVRGNLVAVLVDGRQQAGVHEVYWQTHLSSGAYLYQLQSGLFQKTRKMIWLK